MKKSRFTEEQIAYALRLAEGGTREADVCRQVGISDATFYTWKKKYAALGVSELRRLKMLEDENAAPANSLPRRAVAGGRFPDACRCPRDDCHALRLLFPIC